MMVGEDNDNGFISHDLQSRHQAGPTHMSVLKSKKRRLGTTLLNRPMSAVSAATS